MKKQLMKKRVGGLTLIGMGILLVGCSAPEAPHMEEVATTQEEVIESSESVETTEQKINIDELAIDHVRVSFEKPLYEESSQSLKVSYTIFNQSDAAIQPGERVLAFLQDGTPVDLELGTRTIPAKDSYEGTLELEGVKSGSVMYWNLIGEASSNTAAESLVMLIEEE